LKLSLNSNDPSDLSVSSSDSFKVSRRDLMIVGATAIAARAAPAVALE
jgi:xanthine dehydrogenase YagT iron-sulfur-binding subunit